MAHHKNSNSSSRKCNLNLIKLFPNIRSRKEVLQIISGQTHLKNIFQQWSEPEQELFLQCCTGARRSGVASGLKTSLKIPSYKTLNPLAPVQH